ncbi:MAG: DnaJ domain-containing protein [Actinomycetota bacterium]|nr:DnaJ domain-containing protein [Actinomycetota bacterium]
MGRESDLYAALGVSPDASPAEIAGAYRRLVRAHHPDMRSDSDQPAATPLDEIVAAYEVLRDPDRRAAYDRRHPSTTARRSPRLAAPAVRRGPDLRGVGPVRYHPRG